MSGTFQNIGTCLAVIWLCSVILTKLLNEVILTNEQRLNITLFAKNLWSNSENIGNQALILLFAKKCDQAVTGYLGQKLFSAKSFKFSVTSSTCLLVSSLLLTGVQGNEVLNLAPWISYDRSVRFIERITSETLTQQTLTDEQRQQSQRILAFVHKYLKFANEIHAKEIYSLLFYIALGIINALVFYISLAVGRFMLREVTATGRLPLIWVLTWAHASIIFIFCSFSLLLLSVLSMPVLIFFATVLIGIAFIFKSFFLITWTSVNGIALAWIMSSNALRASVIIAFIPSVLLYIPVFITKVALRFPISFRKSINWILNRMSEKGPLEFVIGIMVALTGIISVINWAVGRID